MSPDDVDICVTCVTDKPPKLPLREELVSLGVEVIYKASGVGAKAAKKESKQAVKDFRKETKDKKRRFRLWPKTRVEKHERERQQRMQEKELYQNRTSISYDTYNQRLHRTGSNDSSSLGSLGSLSTLGGHERLPGTANQDATFPENRESATGKAPQDDTREQPLHEASAKETAEPSSPMGAFISPAVVKSFGSPSYGRHTSGTPLSAATSPTMSYTSFGVDDAILSPGNDENSEGSTFANNHDIEKQLVSATGDRWWYSQVNGGGTDAPQTPKRATQAASQCYNAPPSLPSLDCDTRDHQHTIHRESAWMPCGVGTMCGGGLKTVESGEKKLPHVPAITIERIHNVHSDESVDVIQNHVMNVHSVIAKDFDIVRSYEEEGYDTVMEDRSAEEDGNDGDKLFLSEVAHMTPKASYFQSASPLNSPYSCDSRGSRGQYEEGSGHISKGDFIAMVSRQDVSAEDIKDVLRISPTLARARMRQDGRLPLHATCDRALPDRFERNISLSEALDALIDDVTQWREIVGVVSLFNSDACKIADMHGDLPLHLAARRLIEWEGQWSAKLGGDWGLDETDARKIDKLCAEMVQTIEIVLDPILKTRGLCRKRGSVGRIMPLHVACIFPISPTKMQMLLQTYPEAAGVPCDLGDLLTLMTNYSLPLELLNGERVSIVGVSGAQGESVEDGLSDLVFAFHPNVHPYRLDPERLARIESLVKKAAKRLHRERELNDTARLDAAAHSAWVWFCTFDESSDGKTFDYSNNVKNIVYSLGIHEVKLLAEEKRYAETLLTIATPTCAVIIEARLAGRAMNDIPSITAAVLDEKAPSAAISLSGASCTSSLTGPVSLAKPFSVQAPAPERHLLESQLLEDSALTNPSTKSRSIDTRPARTFNGALVKQVFNVQENSHPTTFIILPYKLVQGTDGSLTLDSPSATPVAIQFAKYLLEMTQPKFIKHQLEKKSLQHASFKLAVDEMDEWKLTEEKNRNIQRELIDIYRAGPAYLYLLDEKDGTPLVEGQQDERQYPIRIVNPAETVKRMMPLMLMGMIHMRGDKSLSVLARTIMDSGDSVPESWVKTAEGVLELLYAGIEDHTTVVSSTLSCKDELVNFVSSINQDSTRCRETTEDGYEWVVELTMLKLTLERSEIRLSFAGLKPVELAGGETIWTRDDSVAIAACLPHQSSQELELLCQESDFHHQLSHAQEVPRQGLELQDQSSSKSEVPRQGLELQDQSSSKSEVSRQRREFQDQISTEPDVLHQVLELQDQWNSKSEVSRQRREFQDQMSNESKMSYQGQGLQYQMSHGSLPQLTSLDSDLPNLMSLESELQHQRSRDSADMQRNTNSFDLDSVLGTHSVASNDTRALDNLLADDKPPSRNLLPPRSRSRGPSPSLGDRSVVRFRAGSIDDSLVSQSCNGSVDVKSLNESLTHSFDSDVSSFAQSRSDIMDLRKSKSWREQLEKEETRLEQIRDKLSALDVADEETLSLRGERLMDDLSLELSQYEASLTGTRRREAQEQEESYSQVSVDEDNVDSTTKLLMRLCNLEERLLTREIDLQQIKLDLHNFELEAVGNTEEWALPN